MGTIKTREVFIEERHEIAIPKNHITGDRIDASAYGLGKNKPRGGCSGPPHIVKNNVVAHDEMVGLVGADA